MRFGSTAKVLARCKLKYHRVSVCAGDSVQILSAASDVLGAIAHSCKVLPGRDSKWWTDLCRARQGLELM